MKDIKTRDIQERIWQACSNVSNVMVGLSKYETIIAFIFLRRIDCLIELYARECASFYSENRQILSDERLDENLKNISGGYIFYNYSGYTFNGILKSNYSLETVLNSYLQGFSKNVLDILEGLNFKHNVAILMRKSRYLVELLQNFSEIDLSNKSIDNEVFVNLIISFAANNLKKKEACTPLNLSNLICKCLLYDDSIANKTIYDPTCGTGRMLANAGLMVKGKENVSLYGQDISEFSSAIAKALVLFIGDEHCQIEHGNTLTDDMFSNRHFQYILSVFPFGISWRPFKEKIEKEFYQDNGRFSLGLPSERDSQFLFIEHIISKMDTNGSRVAFITTESALWNGNANSGESRIRKWLFENDMVETIISLPIGALDYTDIKTCLWILSNKKKSFQKGHVRLIDTSVLTEGKKKISMDSKFVDTVVSEYQSWTHSSMSTIVSNEKFGFYEVELLENGKKSETVTIPLDTDIIDFVKKERQPYAKSIVTVNYSSAEKGYEVKFEKYFKPKEILPTPLKETANNVSSIIDAITTLSPFIKQIGNLKDDKFNSNMWKEKPLRAFIEIIKGRRTEVEVIKTEVYIKVKGQNVGEVQKYPLPKSSVNYATIRCTNKELIASEYLYYLLKGYEKAFMSFGSGMVLKRIDTQAILDFKCLIPPIGEQMRIVSYLDSIVNKIDIIIKTLNSTDNTFTTFRQALIENVVQGKVRF